MNVRTRIWSDIDFERAGKQVGWVNLPHSVTRSAYGMIAIPIAVVKNGTGPTAFLMAGNHGDEYEGQIANSKLIRGLNPKDMKGTVIVTWPRSGSTKDGSNPNFLMMEKM